MKNNSFKIIHEEVIHHDKIYPKRIIDQLKPHFENLGIWEHEFYDEKIPNEENPITK